MTPPAPLHVLAAPMFDPGMARVDVELPAGLTVAQIIDIALPDLPAEARTRLRVALVNPVGSEILLPQVWSRVRPRPGVQVVIRVAPGKGAIRSVLMIAVSVASIALGQPWGLHLAGTIGVSNAVGIALVTAGINIVGSLLVNALVPPVAPSQDKPRERYTINGWRNRYEPDGAVPVVLGTHRYAPPFAAMSWSEIVGDWQYVRALFTFGYGPLEISDFRLGETSLGEYDEVEVEVRDGLAGDAPVSLYPRQILEESIGAELTRPMPRDDAGNILDTNASIETPVVRTTADDTDTVSIVLTWPAGLIYVDGGGDQRTERVDIRIEQRLVTATNWQHVETLNIRARKKDAFFRQHRWKLPSRGRWQIRLTMLTEEPANMGRQRRTVWVALQSIRPEYPLNFREPQALVALRVKATHQLSGQLDDFSALVRRRCLDYDRATGTWVERVTSNPASLYRYVLQSAANPRPVPDAGIDMQQLEDWHEFCRLKGLRYDRVLDDAGLRLRDVLTEIAGAGRASPRHDGVRWGVTIDRPQDLVVDHISPRNSWDFRATRSYTRRPDGLRVRFNDADADYAAAERLVRRPGHTGDIVLTEVLDLPGKTRADEVWREATRRMLEVEHRPDVFEAMQDGPVRVATRGDRVAISQDVLDDVQVAARVLAVFGREITIDDVVTFAAGVDYAVRFRVVSAADPVGTSLVRGVSGGPGETSTLTLGGSGAMPAPGEIVMFGRSGRETHSAVVTAIEMGEDMACLIRAVPAAPEIDATLDALTPPPWSPRVGAELPPSALQPPEPRFNGVFTGASGTSERGRVEVQLVPGSGPVTSARYALRHRLAGATTWSTVYFPVADGGYDLITYLNGTAIELQAAALSSSGLIGPWTPVLPVTVGSGDQALPAALDADAVTVAALPGGARVDFATGDDTATTAVRIYRSMSPVLDRATDAVGAPIAVQPSRRFTTVVGDGTRSNLITNPDLGASGGWNLDGGWQITGGAAQHEPGTGGDIWQSRSLSAGKWYRIGYRMADVAGGSVTPLLTGSTERLGVGRSTDGLQADRIQAVSGNDGVAWRASADFTGRLDDVLLYQETATCLVQGLHHFWLEPLNRDGVPGPVIGPFSATIL